MKSLILIIIVFSSCISAFANNNTDHLLKLNKEAYNILEDIQLTYVGRRKLEKVACKLIGELKNEYKLINNHSSNIDDIKMCEPDEVWKRKETMIFLLARAISHQNRQALECSITAFKFHPVLFCSWHFLCSR